MSTSVQNYRIVSHSGLPFQDIFLDNKLNCWIFLETSSECFTVQCIIMDWEGSGKKQSLHV